MILGVRDTRRAPFFHGREGRRRESGSGVRNQSPFPTPDPGRKTPDVARQIVELRADATTQERIDELAEKSTEGQLSPAEEAEYDDYVEAIDIIGILQAKARSALARHSLS